MYDIIYDNNNNDDNKIVTAGGGVDISWFFFFFSVFSLLYVNTFFALTRGIKWRHVARLACASLQLRPRQPPPPTPLIYVCTNNDGSRRRVVHSAICIYYITYVRNVKTRSALSRVLSPSRHHRRSNGMHRAWYRARPPLRARRRPPQHAAPRAHRRDKTYRTPRLPRRGCGRGGGLSRVLTATLRE